MQLIVKFFQDTSGATAIEYSMIGAIVSIVIIGGTQVMGSKMATNLQTLSDAFN